jgi:hypothetical protein
MSAGVRASSAGDGGQAAHAVLQLGLGGVFLGLGLGLQLGQGGLLGGEVADVVARQEGLIGRVGLGQLLGEQLALALQPVVVGRRSAGCGDRSGIPRAGC